MNASLLILTGELNGTRINLTQERPFTIGSSEQCDFRINDDSLECQHLQISRRGRFYVVSDLNRSSDTRVNGHRIASHILHNLDEISAGSLRLRFCSDDASVDRALHIDSGRLPSLESARTRSAKAESVAHVPVAGIEEKTLSGRILSRDDVLSAHESISIAHNVEPRVAQLRTALDAIYQVSNFVLTEDSPDSLISKVLDVVMLALGPDRAFFMGWDAARGKASVLGARSVAPAPLTLVADSASADLIRQVIEHGMPVLCRPTDRSEGLSSLASGICVPVRSATRRIGAIYIDEMLPNRCFTTADLELLAAIGRQAGLALERVRIYEDMETLFYSCVRALVTAIEAKDVYTYGHSERVAAYSLSIAEELSIDADLMDSVRLGALLHDVGKIGVPEAILFKAGRLTDAEFEIVKTHPARGAEILGHIGDIPDVIAAVRSHHERFDGMGYPDRLSGGDIPIAARIVSVADAFDAMTSDRSYRRNLSIEEAIVEFERGRGNQFAPDVAEAMVHLLRKGVILPSCDLSRKGIDVATRVYTRPSLIA